MIKKRDLLLFLQEKLSFLVEHDDDEKPIDLLNSLKYSFNNLDYNMYWQYSVDLLYRLYKSRLILGFYYGDNEPTIDEYMAGLVVSSPFDEAYLESSWSEQGTWLWWYVPTTLCKGLIKKYDLYDDSEYCEEFAKELEDLFTKAGVPLDIHPLVELDYSQNNHLIDLNK